MSYDRAEIEALVREVVMRTLGGAGGTRSDAQRAVLDETAVRSLPRGATHHVPEGTLITPLARQIALERRIRLVRTADDPLLPAETAVHAQPLRASSKPVVAIGSDHGGYELKGLLKTMLETGEPGYSIIDCGTHSPESVDYPDYAYAVARLVADGRAWRGIIIDGAGIGSCMAANKVPGVRAAMCYDQATAVNSREHNNANVLTLGAGLIGANLARQIVQTWLTTEFAGGRHARRVEKIDQIGARFAKSK